MTDQATGFWESLGESFAAQFAAGVEEQPVARASLEAFTLATMPTYEVNWHHRLLCRKLDDLVEGRIRRLLISCPPRHGKSETVSRRLPAYFLGRYPDQSVIACSYSADLASRMNRDVQRIIDSDAYRRIFPGIHLWGKNVRTMAGGTFLRNSDLFEIVGHAGSYRSAGVGGGIMGMGFDLGVIDDPIKNREEADSPTVRDKIWEWYTSTFYSRKSKDARILLTMTRWNRDDLAGRLMALAAESGEADQWDVVCLPAIAEEPGPDDPRQPGEALWPSRYPVSELLKIKANSIYEWGALWQQNPAHEFGSEWGPEYFPPTMFVERMPTNLILKVLALDPSKGKDAKFGDYSALVFLGADADGDLYCDAIIKRMTTDLIVETALEACKTWGPEGIIVETNQFQELLAQDMIRRSKELGIAFPVFECNNAVNKQVRIRRIGPYLNHKQLRFVASPGTRLLVSQLKEFPLGDHDDGPDALEMAVRLMLDFVHGKGRSAGARLERMKA